MTISRADVVVLGAGPAGLGAAYLLARQGRSVCVLERAPVVGGLAASFEVAGVRVDHGYAELLDDRSLRLTDEGREIATSIVRRHRLAERLLVDIIGLEWEKVHKEADRWEHAISADVEEKLVQLLGDPATCPHGNPIPGSAHKVEGPASVPLTQMQPGPVIVRRISEKAEIDDDAIAFLAGAELIPGSAAVVVSTSTDGVQVTSAAGEQTVPRNLAQLIYAIPA
ncbi:MAG TPA: FAD-dependent oxidoreductase [Acidimicrobiia bacterium]|nr:FAD-dependent oxidoreductase [Acidimicrobiia bacterium]